MEKEKVGNIMIFLIELFLQVCTTIGLCTIMYSIAKQPITPFAIIVWGVTSAIIRIGFYCYENRDRLFEKKVNINEQKSSKKENNNKDSQEENKENSKS